MDDPASPTRGFARMPSGQSKRKGFDPAGLAAAAEARLQGALTLDPWAMQGLDLLCADLSKERLNLSFTGRKLIETNLVEFLVKRGRLPQETPRTPPRPVFIVAPFRSGTTYLHRLMALDPVWRTTATWEVSLAPPRCRRGR